jgi:hypothetical protein
MDCVSANSPRCAANVWAVLGHEPDLLLAATVGPLVQAARQTGVPACRGPSTLGLAPAFPILVSVALPFPCRCAGHPWPEAGASAPGQHLQRGNDNQRQVHVAKLAVLFLDHPQPRAPQINVVQVTSNSSPGRQPVRPADQQRPE